MMVEHDRAVPMIDHDLIEGPDSWNPIVVRV